MFDRLQNVTDDGTKVAFYFTIIHLKNETQLSAAMEEAINLPEDYRNQLFTHIIVGRPEWSKALFKILWKGLQQKKLTKEAYDKICRYIRLYGDGSDWDDVDKKEIGEFYEFCDTTCRARWTTVIDEMGTWMFRNGENVSDVVDEGVCGTRWTVRKPVWTWKVTERNGARVYKRVLKKKEC